MDVAAYMTSLRVIPHAKRGKMDKIKLAHGSLSKVKKGSDDLSPHGSRSDLLKSGDHRFTGFLFDMISNQAKLLEKGDWMLPPSFGHEQREFVLSIVGGSSQSCVAVGLGGKKNIRNVNGEAIEVIVEFFSDDSDAFAGMGMQAVFYLDSTCSLRGERFDGAIYLHGPRKSVPQITKLGNIFKTNFPVDQELCPTGKGFYFIVDLVAVYYTLEQDNHLPDLPTGHRAISAVAVPYTIVNHDYLRMAGYGLTGNPRSTSPCISKSISYKEIAPTKRQ